MVIDVFNIYYFCEINFHILKLIRMTEGTEEPEPMEQGEEIEAPEEAILNNVPILKMIKGEY